MLRPYISTSATAAVTRSARMMPSAPSVFSYHSLVRCASPALPPAPSAIAGTPRAIGTLASVDALASSASLPRIRFAAIAACTSGWVRGVTPDRVSRVGGAERRPGVTPGPAERDVVAPRAQRPVHDPLHPRAIQRDERGRGWGGVDPSPFPLPHSSI